MKILTGVCTGFAVAALCAACGDAGVRATFRAVSDTREQQTLIDANYENARDIPDYVTRGGHLFLRTQVYRAVRPRADAVQYRYWTCEDVVRLKRSPDARALLPDARAVDGGIRWSQCSQLGAQNAADATR